MMIPAVAIAVGLFLLTVIPTVVVDARVSVLVKFPEHSEGGLSGLRQQIGILVNNSINSALIANHEPAGCIKENWVEESELTADDDESSRFLRGGRKLGGNETQSPSSDPSHTGFKCLDCPEGSGCATWCDDAGELPYANSTDLHDDIKSRIREGIAKICKLHDCFHLTECAAICADYELTVDVLTTDTMAPTAAPTPLQECPDKGQCMGKPSSMRMEYTGGHCGGSVTAQIDSNSFECTDYGSSGLPTQAWIVVTRHGKYDKVYHRGEVLLGQTFELVRHEDPGKDFESDLDIFIYRSKSEELSHLGQRMTFQSDCHDSIMTKCQDRYGAVQLKEWQNKDQGLVACDRCDPDMCPDDGVASTIPFGMTMFYNGGNCSQTQQSQEKQDKFECEDYNGGPPSTLGGKSLIVVHKKGDSNTLYHSAQEPVHVGETYKLAHPELLQTFDNDLEIKILDPEYLTVLQKLVFSTKKTLECDNRFGASQLIEWQNSEQGNVQCSDCVV